MRRILVLAATFAVLVAGGTAASAQAYPSRPINFIIAFAPGGPSDVLSRIITGRMGEILKQPFVIENRPGANGTIAAQAVARAAPDGHTILLATNGILATNQFVYKNIGYDPIKDFEPVGLVGYSPNLLYVHPSVEARTLAELIAYAKANPGKLNYGSGGIATSSHLAGELLKIEAKVDITHVPFRGTGPTLQAVLAGHIQMGSNPPPPLLGHVAAGTIRPLAVTSLKRTSPLPDVPAVSELGFPGFDATTWHSLIVPAGTPKEVVDTLHRTLAAALGDPQIRKQLVDLGVDVNPSASPEDFAAFIKSEGPRWGAVAKAANVKLD